MRFSEKLAARGVCFGAPGEHAVGWLDDASGPVRQRRRSLRGRHTGVENRGVRLTRGPELAERGLGRVGLGHGYTAAGPHSLHVGMPVGRAGLGPFLRGLLLGLQRRQTSSRQNTRDRDL